MLILVLCKSAQQHNFIYFGILSSGDDPPVFKLFFVFFMLLDLGVVRPFDFDLFVFLIPFGNSSSSTSSFTVLL